MHIVVLVTAKDTAQAERIARKLVERELAACVNVLPGARSFFRWEGKVDRTREVLLIIKTRRSVFPRLARAVKELHSYSVPEIIALPIVAGSPDYLRWIDASVR
jgi:periplasmic divalent cation tolerance protein